MGKSWIIILRHVVAFAVLLGFGFAFGWYGDSDADRLLDSHQRDPLRTEVCAARCEAHCDSDHLDDDDVGVGLGVDRARCSERCMLDCR